MPKSTIFTSSRPAAPQHHQEQVGRLEIPVHHSLLVRGRQSRGDLIEQRRDPIQRQRAAASQLLGQVDPLEELHDDVRGSRRAAGEKSTTCTMLGWRSAEVTCASRWKRASRLASLAISRSRIFRAYRPQPRVRRLEDLPHPPLADATDDPIGIFDQLSRLEGPTRHR
jgi:hypothetical protein